MRQFLVTVQVILVVAGLGLGGYVGYRAFTLMGKDDTGQLQSYLILAVLALVLVAAAGVARPGQGAEPPSAEPAPPAPQRRAPVQQPGQYSGYGSFGPGPHTGSQPPIRPGGPHTGSQPPVGGPEQYGGRTEKFPPS